MVSGRKLPFSSGKTVLANKLPIWKDDNDVKKDNQRIRACNDLLKLLKRYHKYGQNELDIPNTYYDHLRRKHVDKDNSKK
jgi:hypothetical protein